MKILLLHVETGHQKGARKYLFCSHEDNEMQIGFLRRFQCHLLNFSWKVLKFLTLWSLKISFYIFRNVSTCTLIKKEKKNRKSLYLHIVRALSSFMHGANPIK